MKKRRSFSHKIGIFLFFAAGLILLIGIIMCYIGQNIGIVVLYISFPLFLIADIIYKIGVKRTDNLLGNDNDENN